MANHASALKADRQNKKRRIMNRSNRSSLRTSLRKFNDQLQAGNAVDAQNILPTLYAEIDNAKRRNAISENAAARQKSRITKRLNATLSAAEKG